MPLTYRNCAPPVCLVLNETQHSRAKWKMGFISNPAPTRIVRVKRCLGYDGRDDGATLFQFQLSTCVQHRVMHAANKAIRYIIQSIHSAEHEAVEKRVMLSSQITQGDTGMCIGD